MRAINEKGGVVKVATRALSRMLFASVLLQEFDEAHAADAPWLDACQVTDPKLQRLLQSEAFLVHVNAMTHDSVNHTWKIDVSPFNTKDNDPLSPLDPSTVYYGAPHVVAGRSGVLIGPDVVLTAPHQSPQNQGQWNVVFGLQSSMVGGVCTPPDFAHVPDSNVFTAGSTIANTYNYVVSNSGYGPTHYDYMAYKIDRPANRPYLRIRRSGQAEFGDPAAMIGHPARLTTKVDPGAILLGQRASDKGGVLVNGTHGLPGTSGAMIYNMARDYVEAVNSYGIGCAPDIQLPNGLWSVLLDCPASPYGVNLPLGDVANAVGIPAYTLVAAPLDSVRYITAVGGVPSPASTTYTLTSPSTAPAPIQWQIIPPVQAPAGQPNIVLNSVSNSGVLAPNSNQQFSISATGGSQCGIYNRSFTIRDVTNGYSDEVKHRFEIGLTEFLVAPSDDFVYEKMIPPYNGAVKVYALSNPRPTAVSITVQSSNWIDFSVDQSGSVSSPMPGSVTIVLGPAGSKTSTANIRVSLNEIGAGALPAETENYAAVNFVNNATSCFVTTKISRGVRFSPGKQGYARAISSLPPIVGPPNGSGYGAPVQDSLTISDNFVIDSVAVDVGLYNFPLNMIQYEFSAIKIVLVSPSSVRYTLWDSSQIPARGYYSPVYLDSLADAVGVLHIDDVNALSPVGALLNGQSALGTWSIEVSGKQSVSSYFSNWALRFWGHAPGSNCGAACMNGRVWTIGNNLGTARTEHTATLLPSGKVLVAGGATVVRMQRLQVRRYTTLQAMHGAPRLL